MKCIINQTSENVAFSEVYRDCGDYIEVESFLKYGVSWYFYVTQRTSNTVSIVGLLPKEMRDTLAGIPIDGIESYSGLERYWYCAYKMMVLGKRKQYRYTCIDMFKLSSNGIPELCLITTLGNMCDEDNLEQAIYQRIMILKEAFNILANQFVAMPHPILRAIGNTCNNTSTFMVDFATEMLKENNKIALQNLAQSLIEIFIGG